MIDISAFIGPVFSAICAFAGAWLALSTRIAQVEVKVDNLATSVSKHNQVIERTFKLEERVDGALHSLDEVKKEIDHYHHH